MARHISDFVDHLKGCRDLRKNSHHTAAVSSTPMRQTRNNRQASGANVNCVHEHGPPPWSGWEGRKGAVWKVGVGEERGEGGRQRGVFTINTS